MGWTYTRRDRGQSHLDFFKGEFDCENEHGKWEVLAAAGGFKAVYLAMRITHKTKEFNQPFVLGVVCLVNWRHHDQYNFGWKDVSEEMGIYETECPRRILKLLSPVDAGQFTGSALERATEWRAKCEANLAKHAAFKLQVGTILRTKTPQHFVNGKQPWGDYDTFICTDVKRLRFDALWKMDFRGQNGKVPVGRTAVRFRTRQPLLDATVLTCEWWDVFEGEPPAVWPDSSPETEVQ